MDTLPIFLSVRGRQVLVDGGGPQAARRAERALSAGAEVTVFAPEPGDDLLRLAEGASLGLRTYGEQQGNIFLGREFGQNRDYSEEAARLIDEEVRVILDRNYGRAKEVITQNRAQLVRLVDKLIEVETLDREQFEELMNAPEPEVAVDQPVEVLLPGD